MVTQLTIQLDDGGSIPTLPLHTNKAHQRLIRERRELEYSRGEIPIQLSLLNDLRHPPKADISTAIVRPISYTQAKQIILDYEWLGSMAQRTTHCFGIFFEGILGGVTCFSIPPTPQAATGVCGNDYASIVKTLSRGACVYWAHPHSASKLISLSLKWMIDNTPFRIFVAYSDPRAGEIGTVYQATNWLYTGTTAGDIEYYIDKKWKSGRTARHTSYKRRGIDYPMLPKRKAIGKHRYVFVGGNKKEKKEFLKLLKYPVLTYPKREEEDDN